MKLQLKNLNYYWQVFVGCNYLLECFITKLLYAVKNDMEVGNFNLKLDSYIDTTS